MSDTYAQLIDKVRDWANRDSNTLPNSVIGDSLQWAADKAYRTLRIPPLENTIQYTDVTALNAATTMGGGSFFGRGVTELNLPADLIEFIYIRSVDDNDRTVRIFNEKADLRTFYDQYAEKYNDFAYWTRLGNTILVSPGFGQINNEVAFELHYYRRLPALHARYLPNAANANAGLTTETAPMVVSGTRESPAESRALHQSLTSDTTWSDSATTGFETTTTDHWGIPVDNWLKDENQRVVLFGALAECFSYLQQDDQAGKYLDMFFKEVEELNQEEAMRRGSGGNVQINFNGRGLI